MKISGMPQMQSAFSGWMTTFVLNVITQSTVDGFVVESTTPITYKGTVQPLSPEQTALKPDGQRSWEWLQIHVLTGQNNLKTNDRVVYNEKPFKVMSVKDYTLNNYVEYHLVADYEAL